MLARKLCASMALCAVFGSTPELRAGEAVEPASVPAPPSGEPAQADPWCPPGVETLPGEICYVPAPAKASRRTLVVFLHGLTDVGSGWQHSMVRGMAAGGQRWGYAVLAPKGRVGIGPGRRADQIAWPTAEAMRAAHEDVIVSEWKAAQRQIEAREGQPFDEVFVMGFSNGAYYASSLALRGRLEVDGYAMFAGGSAPPGSDRAAKGVKNRRPVFVGIASRDDTAKKGRELAAALAKLGWPHESSSRPVGHVVADVQLERALAYLRARVDIERGRVAAAQPEAPVSPSAQPPAKPKAAQPPAKRPGKRPGKRNAKK